MRKVWELWEEMVDLPNGVTWVVGCYAQMGITRTDVMHIMDLNIGGGVAHSYGLE